MCGGRWSKSLQKTPKKRVKKQAVIIEQQKVRIGEWNSAVKELVRGLVAREKSIPKYA
jgi:hypothetical protein